MRNSTSYAIGIDVGGTFTDCVVLDDAGALTTGKAPSTPPDFWHGVLDAIGDAAGALGLARADLLRRARLIVHGTTIAENALVTGTGARTGLITTRGFEDTLLIMRAKGRLIGLSEREMTHVVRHEKPMPIVPRALIAGVVERVDAEGEVVTPLDPASAERAIRHLVEQGAEALGVSLLWSFLNPAHEQAIAALAAELAPGLFVTISSELAPYTGEYERTATVAINAYVGTVAERYLRTLTDTLAAEGATAPLLITQAYGGALSAAAAARNGVGLIESGPASGMVASRFVGRLGHYPNIIATDMGGTTFKAGLIADGAMDLAAEPQFGKYAMMAPKIDVRSVGQGGGSIAYVDEESGGLRVGPQSAGSVPGPVCYGRGGTRPTLADADLVLGYLNPAFFLGGRMPLDRAAAERAIEEQIARPLGLSTVEAAAGIYTIACAESADLIRRISIERGHDPREFVVFAYGGAGPMHAAAYAHHLESPRIVVPFTAPVHCAMGAVCADVVRETGLSDPMRFPVDPARVNANFERLETRARADLCADGFAEESVVIRRYLELKFRRQVHVVRIPVADGSLGDEALEALQDDFERAYERRYGRGSGYRAAGVEIVSFVVEGTGRVPKPRLRTLRRTGRIAPAALVEDRLVHFVDLDNPGAPPRAEPRTPVYRLPGLRAGNELDGPAIVETPTTTILLPPGYKGAVDEYLNFVIETGRSRNGH
ncbi:MAG TPA: hydantoinase/oxoprolinase family protein [Chloroflexota bacterium]|nr:hydantoinase/oxoprolinase family protein [Chloroflexota bacterium]